MSEIKLKHKAIDNLPSYVREDYQKFTSFLDIYHDWLESQQIDIATMGDIDKTDARFIEYFKKETESNGLAFPNIDDRFLLRHIKNIYLSKGTEESYRTLFKLMFNKDIVIKYPETMCIKPSSGKWEQIYSIFVQTEEGSASTLKDRVVKVLNPISKRIIEVTINQVILNRSGGGLSTISLSNGGSGYTNPTISFVGGGGQGAAAVATVIGGVIASIQVTNPGKDYTSPPVITITDSTGHNAVVRAITMYTLPDVYECQIDRQYYGNIEVGDRVTFGTFRGVIIPTIVSYNIIKPGSNFKLGQVYNVDTVFGKGTVVKISKLNPTKGITELKFIKFGFGYVSNFISDDLIPPDIASAKVGDGFVTTGAPGPYLHSGSFSEYVTSNPSGVWILNENYTATPGQEGYSYDYAGEVVREFYSNPPADANPANGASIEFILGAVAKYPGYYVNSDGMLSNDLKIQDSRLYQKYSYIIQVDEKLDKYRDIVKTHLHPAGMALFGEYNIRNEFKVKMKLTSLLSLFAVNHAESCLTLDSALAYPTLNKFDECFIQDYDINTDAHFAKESTVTVVANANDTTTTTDSGLVQLNLYVNPLEQYITSVAGYYVNQPNATF